MINNPFSRNYKPQIEWGAQNLDRQRGQNVAKHLEVARLRDPAHDAKTGLTLGPRDHLMPREFHIFSRAVPKGGKR